MKTLKSLFIGLSVLGITAAAHAYPGGNSSYDSPTYSPGTGMSNMGLAGAFNFYYSSTNHRTVMVLSSTGGVVSSLTITAPQGNFGNITSTGITVTGDIYLPSGSSISAIISNIAQSTNTLASLVALTTATNASNVALATASLTQSVYQTANSTGITVNGSLVNYINFNANLTTVITGSTVNVSAAAGGGGGSGGSVLSLFTGSINTVNGGSFQGTISTMEIRGTDLLLKVYSGSATLTVNLTTVTTNITNLNFSTNALQQQLWAIVSSNVVSGAITSAKLASTISITSLTAGGFTSTGTMIGLNGLVVLGSSTSISGAAQFNGTVLFSSINAPSGFFGGNVLVQNISTGPLPTGIMVSSVAAGVVGITQLNSAGGTPGVTTFYRGDGQWASPPGSGSGSGLNISTLASAGYQNNSSETIKLPNLVGIFTRWTSSDTVDLSSVAVKNDTATWTGAQTFRSTVTHSGPLFVNSSSNSITGPTQFNSTISVTNVAIGTNSTIQQLELAGPGNFKLTGGMPNDNGSASPPSIVFQYSYDGDVSPVISSNSSQISIAASASSLGANRGQLSVYGNNTSTAIILIGEASHILEIDPSGVGGQFKISQTTIVVLVGNIGLGITTPSSRFDIESGSMSVHSNVPGITAGIEVGTNPVLTAGTTVQGSMIVGPLNPSVLVSSVAGGTVGLGQLSATGSPSATTFLRGDNTWAVPAGSGGGGISGSSKTTGGFVSIASVTVVTSTNGPLVLLNSSSMTINLSSTPQLNVQNSWIASQYFGVNASTMASGVIVLSSFQAPGLIGSADIRTTGPAFNAGDMVLFDGAGAFKAGTVIPSSSALTYNATYQDTINDAGQGSFVSFTIGLAKMLEINKSSTVLLNLYSATTTLNGLTLVNSTFNVAGTSVTFQSSTMTIGNVKIVFPPTAGLSGQVVVTDGNNNWGYTTVAGPAADNMGTHVATKTVNMANFAVVNATAVYIGTNSMTNTLIGATTSFGMLAHLITLSTGSSVVFDVTQATVTIASTAAVLIPNGASMQIGGGSFGNIGGIPLLQLKGSLSSTNFGMAITNQTWGVSSGDALVFTGDSPDVVQGRIRENSSTLDIRAENSQDIVLDNSGSPALRAHTGNVAIEAGNSVAPASALDVVAGSVTIRVGGIGIGSNTVISAIGYIGYGTNTPSFPLDIYGVARISSMNVTGNIWSTSTVIAGSFYGTNPSTFGFVNASSIAATNGVTAGQGGLTLMDGVALTSGGVITLLNSTQTMTAAKTFSSTTTMNGLVVMTSTVLVSGSSTSFSAPTQFNGIVLASSENITFGLFGGTLAPTGVTAATYGSATQVAQLVIGQDGRIQSASNVSITGSGGGSGSVALSTQGGGAYQTDSSVTIRLPNLVGVFTRNSSSDTIDLSSMAVTNATQTYSGWPTFSGKLSFQTTAYAPFPYPFAVGNTTIPVAFSTNTFNGLVLYDGNTSTGTNQGYYRIVVPGNVVYGSTPNITVLFEDTTGQVNQQTSYVVSFSSGQLGFLAISSAGASVNSLSFSSPVVVNVNGVTGIYGGERISTGTVALNGLWNMIGNGNCIIYMQIVRDGNSATNDPSGQQTAVAGGIIAWKEQQ